MDYTIYRYSVTGVFGYVGYQREEELFAISSVVSPSAKVRISGDGFKYVCKYNVPSTLHPCFITKTIFDETTGQPAAALQWKNTRSYTLLHKNTQYYIRSDKQQYVVSLSGQQPLLTINRIPKDLHVSERILEKYWWSDIKPRFTLSTSSNLSIELLAILSAVPMLCID